jgi:hypothetical protein
MEAIKFNLTEDQMLNLLMMINCEDMGNSTEIFTNNNENDLRWHLPLTDVEVESAPYEAHVVGIYYIHFLDPTVLEYYIGNIKEDKGKLEELTHLINKFQKDWGTVCSILIRNKLKDLGYIVDPPDWEEDK